MGNVELKYKKLISALDRLEEVVSDLENFEKHVLLQENKQQLDYIKNENLYRTFRDSMIQRFELAVDLFWKYIKIYLEKKMQQPPEFNAPKQVIRAACKSKLISEDNAETIIEIITDRNKTSHIYKEEIADQIGKNIPKYYELISKLLESIKP